MSEAQQLVYKIIDAQYAANTAIPLLSAADVRLRLTSSIGLLREVYDNRDSIIKVLVNEQEPQHQSIANYMTNKTRKSIYHLNQFVHFTPKEEIALQRLYVQLVQQSALCLKSSDGFAVFTHSMVSLVVGHSSLLVGQLTSMRDSNLITNLASRPVCAEYSPGLQLRVLGLSQPLSSLKEPILDMGCGKSGTLVRHLRSLGLETIGIDRDVAPSPYLFEADWTSFPLGTNEWGTVLSHMAFSNHFMHHHRRIDGRPQQYAQLYMRILEALTDGGSFFYAPGLPFMERLLPSYKYAVRTAPIDPDKGIYSTQVTRR